MSQMVDIVEFYMREETLTEFRQLVLMYLTEVTEESIDRGRELLKKILALIQTEGKTREDILFIAAVLVCFMLKDSRQMREKLTQPQPGDNDYVSWEEMRDFMEGFNQ